MLRFRPRRDRHVVISPLIVLLLCALVAGGAVLAVTVSAFGWLPVAGGAVLLILWARRERRIKARLVSLEGLHAFNLRLAGIDNSDDIIAVALAEAARMLRSSEVELRLPVALGSLRCVAGPDGELWREVDPPGGSEGDVIAGTAPVVVAGSAPGEPARLAAPVVLGDLGVAVVRVTGERERSFGEDDLLILEALTAGMATALTSSQRLDQLRLEVAAREHQALHDGLTGLANRTLFTRGVDEALALRARGELVGVMLMDLDGFKDINDTLGHHAGDRVLEAVALRVVESLDRGRLAARLGGDEFAFIVTGARTPEEVLAVARSVHGAVSRPVAVDGMDLELRASIGVSIAPEDGADAATLLRRADVAMYAAKRSRRGVASYDREIDIHAHRRMVLNGALRQAIGSGQLEIWYQPLARPGNGEVTGMEALLRWKHPEYGSVPPSEFVPVAEQSGLIEPITWWVLESATAELVAWRREGFELTMAVNISARSLTVPNLVERLRDLLQRQHLPAADLTLEITESMMMTDPDGAERVLEDLDRLGVKIAIDDFGTGWSSLSRLRRMPVHTVKVDRSFVMSMHRDEGDEAIVRTTIELARNMGHQVVAEGVERQDTWDRLVALGCDLVQGYLLAPAMPIAECREWLRRRQSPRMAAIRPLRRVQGA